MDLMDLVPDKIKCLVCGKRHFSDEDTFFTFYGNVTVGLGGGIIGNNLDDDGAVNRLSFVCRSEKCLASVFDVTPFKNTALNNQLIND